MLSLKWSDVFNTMSKWWTSQRTWRLSNKCYHQITHPFLWAQPIRSQEGGPPPYEGHYTFRGNQRKGKISARESLFGDKNQWRAPPASSNPGEEYICKVCGAVNKMLVARITARAVLLSKSYLCACTVCAVEWICCLYFSARLLCISLQAYSVFVW